MLQTRTRRLGRAIGAFVATIVLVPVSIWAEESPACQDWTKPVDDERVSEATGGAFHPFFSIATAEDVTRCLNAGSNPNSRTDEGWAPLHLAAAVSDTAAVIVVLLESGADLLARSEYGDTPLHLAAMNSNADVTLTLIDAGADVNARGEERSTPLHYAAALNPNVEIINALLEGESDPNARMEYGETPLHAAAMMNENPAVLVALLDGGADPIARDDDDQAPWDYAKENQSLMGTTAYWCLNDARWRAMESDDQQIEALPSWCRSLVSGEETSSQEELPSNAEAKGQGRQPIEGSKLWLSDGDLPAAFMQHRDWIESCTDLPVLVVDQDLVLYSIDAEDGLEQIAQCLLSTVDRVARQSSSDVGAVTMYLPPFSNYNEPKDANPVRVPEALIRTKEGILIIAGTYGDYGLDHVERVSEKSYIAQINWGMTHTRVYHVIADEPKSVYVTNGDIVEIWEGKNGCFLIVVEEHKRYFSGGGAFLLDGIVDCEGNILDIHTLTSDCMSVEELSDKSGLDLSRVRRSKVCVSR